MKFKQVNMFVQLSIELSGLASWIHKEQKYRFYAAFFVSFLALFLWWVKLGLERAPFTLYSGTPTLFNSPPYGQNMQATEKLAVYRLGSLSPCMFLPANVTIDWQEFIN